MSQPHDSDSFEDIPDDEIQIPSDEEQASLGFYRLGKQHSYDPGTGQVILDRYFVPHRRRLASQAKKQQPDIDPDSMALDNLDSEPLPLLPAQSSSYSLQTPAAGNYKPQMASHVRTQKTIPHTTLSATSHRLKKRPTTLPSEARTFYEDPQTRNSHGWRSLQRISKQDLRDKTSAFRDAMRQDGCCVVQLFDADEIWEAHQEMLGLYWEYNIYFAEQDRPKFKDEFGHVIDFEERGRIMQLLNRKMSPYNRKQFTDGYFPGKSYAMPALRRCFNTKAQWKARQDKTLAEFLIGYLEHYGGVLQGKMNMSPHAMPVKINKASHHKFCNIRRHYPEKQTNFWLVPENDPMNLAEDVDTYEVPPGCWYVWDHHCVHAHVANETDYVLFAAYMGFQVRDPTEQAKRDIWWRKKHPKQLSELEDVQQAAATGNSPYAYVSGGSEASTWHNVVWWHPHAWLNRQFKYMNELIAKIQRANGHPWFELYAENGKTKVREAPNTNPPVELNNYSRLLLGYKLSDGSSTNGRTETNVRMEINRIWGGAPKQGAPAGDVNLNPHLDTNPFAPE